MSCPTPGRGGERSELLFLKNKHLYIVTLGYYVLKRSRKGRILLSNVEEFKLSEHSIKSIEFDKNVIWKQGVEFVEPMHRFEIDGYKMEIYYREFPKSLAKGRFDFVVSKVRHLENNNAICPLCKTRWIMKTECGRDRDYKKQLARGVAMRILFPEY